MSNVYKALKRAEREGHWRNESADGAAQAAELAPPPSATAAGEQGSASPRPPRNTGGGAELRHIAASNDPAAKSESPGERHEFLRELKATRPGVERELVEPPAPGGMQKLWRLLTAPPDREDNQDMPAVVIGDEALSSAAEKFELLRVWLQSWTQANHERAILISSSLPGEGKSFVSLNLALALASSGHRVMLVDADLRKPCLYRSFALAPLNGLGAYLEGRAHFEHSLTATGLPNLTLVSSQEEVESGTELIAGPGTREFLQRARLIDPEQFILIDSPPALAAPEAEILADVVDAVLFVIAANRTPRELVKKALSLLAHAAKVGVVLNRFEDAYSTSRRLGYKYGGYATPLQRL